MKKILLVDNLKSVLEREKGLLDRDVFNIFTAASGAEALGIHKKEKVDIIVMDLNMPDMAGDEVTRLIRRDPDLKKVSIMLATLLDDEGERERCAQSGANATIKKPISRDDLTQKLAGFLGIPSRQAIRIIVKIKLEGKVGGDFFIANTVDVSVSGLLFECDRDIPVGSAIETSFFLPLGAGFGRIIARAEIMRIAPSEGYRRYGVKFLEFKEGKPEFIGEFIEKKTGKFEQP